MAKYRGGIACEVWGWPLLAPSRVTSRRGPSRVESGCSIKVLEGSFVAYVFFDRGSAKACFRVL